MNRSRVRTGVLLAVILSSLVCSVARGQTWVWTQRDPAGGTANWRSVASSSDGTKLVACANGDHLYTSTDSGVTWTVRESNRNWRSVASSSDATKLVACAWSGFLYTSTDSGTTWTAGASNRSWYGVASSSDGTKLVACVLGGYVYTGQLALAPTVTTTAISNVTDTTADSGGNVTDDGGDRVTARGVYWSTFANPTIDDDHTTDGTGTATFTSGLTGLRPDTTYYVAAYATNSEGTAYGDDVTLTTPAEETPPEPETAPDLRVTIECATAQAVVGDELTFEIAVENVGDGGATDVLLTVPLPENTEFISAWRAASEAAQAAPLNVSVEITIELGDVAPGEDVQIELVLRALVAGQITVSASATSEQTPTPASAQTTAEVEVEDVDWTIIETITPIHACGVLGPCGVLGIMPVFVLLLLVGLKRRGRTRSSPPRKSAPAGCSVT